MTTLRKPADAPASEMLTPSEAARILGLSPQYLAKDRHEARQGGTPPKVPFFALGHRSVRYARADVQAFLDARRKE